MTTTERTSGEGATMALPVQSLQLYEGAGSKRKLNPTDDVPPPKRRKHQPCYGGRAMRPITSGEHLWGPSFTTSLYCSDTDKDIFGIRFESKRNKRSTSKASPLFQSTRLRSVEELQYPGDASLKAIIALLAPYRLLPRKRGQGRMLQLRCGDLASVVATDAVFQVSSTGSMVVYADFAGMGHRRERHSMALLPETKKEKKENRERRAREQRRITPRKEEEDAQIALIMAAMVQEMLRSGERNQPGAWARVIGISAEKIFLYRSWITRRFVEKFEAREGFSIQYRSVLLKDKHGVLEQLHHLLREIRPPSDQQGGAVV
ncbi:hypothetical protein IF2G_10702 [Cordyceps javanica]|nr:hypothetical protein IF2G_10702 [Cordyceps javanica]